MHSEVQIRLTLPANELRFTFLISNTAWIQTMSLVRRAMRSTRRYLWPSSKVNSWSLASRRCVPGSTRRCTPARPPTPSDRTWSRASGPGSKILTWYVAFLKDIRYLFGLCGGISNFSFCMVDVLPLSELLNHDVEVVLNTPLKIIRRAGIITMVYITVSNKW